MKKILLFTAPFLIAGTTVSAGCANFEDGSMTSAAPKYRICYDDVCDETQLSWVCSNIDGTQHRYANGWATYYTSPQSGEESYTVTWQGRTIDEEKHSRLSIEEVDSSETFTEPSFQGIGRLASLKDEKHDAFYQCLSSDLSAVACMGVHVTECRVDPYDEIDCLIAEQDRWQDVLAETLTEKFVAAGGQQFSLDRSEDVEHAQILWKESRDFDCEISAWTNYNVFDGELGKLSCLSDYTARRVDFLRSMQLGMEFDG